MVDDVSGWRTSRGPHRFEMFPEDADGNDDNVAVELAVMASMPRDAVAPSKRSEAQPHAVEEVKGRDSLLTADVPLHRSRLSSDESNAAADAVRNGSQASRGSGDRHRQSSRPQQSPEYYSVSSRRSSSLSPTEPAWQTFEERAKQLVPDLLAGVDEAAAHAVKGRRDTISPFRRVASRGLLRRKAASSPAGLHEPTWQRLQRGAPPSLIDMLRKLDEAVTSSEPLLELLQEQQRRWAQPHAQEARRFSLRGDEATIFNVTQAVEDRAEASPHLERMRSGSGGETEPSTPPASSARGSTRSSLSSSRLQRRLQRSQSFSKRFRRRGRAAHSHRGSGVPPSVLARMRAQRRKRQSTCDQSTVVSSAASHTGHSVAWDELQSPGARGGMSPGSTGHFNPSVVPPVHFMAGDSGDDDDDDDDRDDDDDGGGVARVTAGSFASSEDVYPWREPSIVVEEDEEAGHEDDDEDENGNLGGQKEDEGGAIPGESEEVILPRAPLGSPVERDDDDDAEDDDEAMVEYRTATLGTTQVSSPAATSSTSRGDGVSHRSASLPRAASAASRLRRAALSAASSSSMQFAHDDGFATTDEMHERNTGGLRGPAAGLPPRPQRPASSRIRRDPPARSQARGPRPASAVNALVRPPPRKRPSRAFPLPAWHQSERARRHWATLRRFVTMMPVSRSSRRMLEMRQRAEEALERGDVSIDPEDADAQPVTKRGNPIFYTMGALQRRRAISNDSAVVAAIRSQWQVLVGDKPQGQRKITQSEYMVYFYAIHRWLLPEESVEAAREAVRRDWEWDSHGLGEMDYPAFHDALFELIDNWCNSLNPVEYTSWLEKAWSHIGQAVLKELRALQHGLQRRGSLRQAAEKRRRARTPSPRRGAAGSERHTRATPQVQAPPRHRGQPDPSRWDQVFRLAQPEVWSPFYHRTRLEEQWQEVQEAFRADADSLAIPSPLAGALPTSSSWRVARASTPFRGPGTDQPAAAESPVRVITVRRLGRPHSATAGGRRPDESRPPGAVAWWMNAIAPPRERSKSPMQSRRSKRPTATAGRFAATSKRRGSHSDDDAPVTGADWGLTSIATPARSRSASPERKQRDASPTRPARSPSGNHHDGTHPLSRPQSGASHRSPLNYYHVRKYAGLHRPKTTGARASVPPPPLQQDTNETPPRAPSASSAARPTRSASPQRARRRPVSAAVKAAAYSPVAQTTERATRSPAWEPEPEPELAPQRQSPVALTVQGARAGADPEDDYREEFFHYGEGTSYADVLKPEDVVTKRLAFLDDAPSSVSERKSPDGTTSFSLTQPEKSANQPPRSVAKGFVFPGAASYDVGNPVFRKVADGAKPSTAEKRHTQRVALPSIKRPKTELATASMRRREQLHRPGRTQKGDDVTLPPIRGLKAASDEPFHSTHPLVRWAPERDVLQEILEKERGDPPPPNRTGLREEQHDEGSDDDKRHFTSAEELARSLSIPLAPEKQTKPNRDTAPKPRAEKVVTLTFPENSSVGDFGNK